MEPIKFSAHCAAQVSKSDAALVLLRFTPITGHFFGEMPKALGELKQGKRYRITIEEEE